MSLFSFLIFSQFLFPQNARTTNLVTAADGLVVIGAEEPRVAPGEVRRVEAVVGLLLGKGQGGRGKGEGAGGRGGGAEGELAGGAGAAAAPAVVGCSCGGGKAPVCAAVSGRGEGCRGGGGEGLDGVVFFLTGEEGENKKRKEEVE